MFLRKIFSIVIISILIFTITGCSLINSSRQTVKNNEQNNKSSENLNEGIEENKTVYISASSLKVHDSPSLKSRQVANLVKGSEVKIDDESKDEKNQIWYKVEYGMGSKLISGWIAAQYTVKNKNELLGKSLQNIDLAPQDKADEYTDNPKIKVKGIYVTSSTAGSSKIDSLIKMANRSQINAFVIDVKDDNGRMLFHTDAAEVYCPEANKRVPVKDIESLMRKLKENNIYTIARIVSFKDPLYTEAYPERAIVYKSNGKLYKNSDNIPWASPYDRELWNYNISVAKEAANAGFNEIQFDYVRFPASNGGKLDRLLDYRNTTGETKPQLIQDYLKQAYKELSPLKIYISADIFGLVASVPDDMSLGQYWEAVSNVVDYVSPMMYPSHYADGTYNLSVPDAKPYETIFNSTRDSVSRNKNIKTPAVIRPWIQDFTAKWVKGHITYGKNQVEGEIKALKDCGIDEYLLWNANNNYTEDAVK